jgi:signal transduction histidine kinase
MPSPASAAALAEVLPIGVLLADDDGSVLYANPALVEIFDGATPDQTLSQLARHTAYGKAHALWSAGDDRRVRCTLPDGRVLEGLWHRLAGGRSLTVTDATSDALIRRRLRQHNRALAELVATKTELVSALLHEVRTPLTAARTMASLLPSTPDDPVAGALERNLGRLEDVTREIATISGIENGTLDVRSSPVDLGDLLRSVAASLSPPAVVIGLPDASASGDPAALTSGESALLASGESALLTSGGPGLLTSGDPGLLTSGDPGLLTSGDPGLLTSGDPGLLGDMFGRLITAVRAVTGGGDVVEAGRDGEQWRFSLPLPPSVSADQLFTATNATALMFARAVVGRHGGSVGVEHERLTVRLPLMAAPSSEPPPA